MVHDINLLNLVIANGTILIFLLKNLCSMPRARRAITLRHKCHLCYSTCKLSIKSSVTTIKYTCTSSAVNHKCIYKQIVQHVCITVYSNLYKLTAEKNAAINEL